MKYEIKDVVTLGDDKQYIVMSTAEFENKRYLFLINLENEKDFKICEEDNEELYEIDDKDLISKVVPILHKKLVDEIENI